LARVAFGDCPGIQFKVINGSVGKPKAALGQTSGIFTLPTFGVHICAHWLRDLILKGLLNIAHTVAVKEPNSRK
jgi:hypothetical protein